MSSDSDDNRKRGSDSEDSDDENVPDGEYVVERIMKIKWDQEDKQVKYFIKWKGWNQPEDNTWEPEENLTHCPEMVKEWLPKASALRTEYQKKRMDAKKARKEERSQKRERKRQKKLAKENRRSGASTSSTRFTRPESSDADSDSDDEPPTKAKPRSGMDKKIDTAGLRMSEDSSASEDDSTKKPKPDEVIKKRPGPKSKTLESPTKSLDSPSKKRPGPKSKTIETPVASSKKLDMSDDEDTVEKTVSSSIKKRPGPKSKTAESRVGGTSSKPVVEPTNGSDSKSKTTVASTVNLNDDEDTVEITKLSPAKKRPGPKSKTVEPPLERTPSKAASEQTNSSDSKLRTIESADALSAMVNSTDDTDIVEKTKEPSVKKRPGPKSKTDSPIKLSSSNPAIEETNGSNSKLKNAETPVASPIVNLNDDEESVEKAKLSLAKKRPGPKSKTVTESPVEQSPSKPAFDQTNSSDSKSKNVDTPFASMPVFQLNDDEDTVGKTREPLVKKRPGPKSKRVASPVELPSSRPAIEQTNSSNSEPESVQTPVASKPIFNLDDDEEDIVVKTIEPLLKKRPGPKSKRVDSPVEFLSSKTATEQTNGSNSKVKNVETPVASMSIFSLNDDDEDTVEKTREPLVKKRPGPKSKRVDSPVEFLSSKSATEQTNGSNSKVKNVETPVASMPILSLNDDDEDIVEKTREPLVKKRPGPKSKRVDSPVELQSSKGATEQRNGSNSKLMNVEAPVPSPIVNSSEDEDTVEKTKLSPVQRRPGPKSKTVESPFELPLNKPAIEQVNGSDSARRPGPKSRTLGVSKKAVVLEPEPVVKAPPAKPRPGPKSKTRVA